MSMSPYGLVQERVSRDLHFPWRVLVCCALLNRTTKEQARPALSAFFAWWPDPLWFTVAGRGPGLHYLLEPLGLVNRRAHLLHAMTEGYVAKASPYELPGVGQYARDALDLFCAGRVPFDRKISDHYLNAYADWRLEGGARIEWDEEGFLEWALASVN